MSLCPEDERLAVFVEGGLSPGDRATVLAHLADCPDCRTVVLSASAVRQDLAAAERGKGGLLTASGHLAWLTLAAGFLLSSGGISYWLMSRPAPMSEIELVEPLLGDPRPLSQLWMGGVVRGSEGPTRSASDAFRFGSLLIDLRLSLAAGDAERARERLQLAASRLRGIDFMEEDAAFFAEARRRAEARENLPLIAADLLAREAHFSEKFDATYLAFGRWAEAGRLAAASGKGTFFESARYRRFPAWLHARVGEELGPETRVELSRIEAVLARGPWDERQLGGLEDGFTRLMTRFETTGPS